MRKITNSLYKFLLHIRWKEKIILPRFEEILDEIMDPFIMISDHHQFTSCFLLRKNSFCAKFLTFKDFENVVLSLPNIIDKKSTSQFRWYIFEKSISFSERESLFAANVLWICLCNYMNKFWQVIIILEMMVCKIILFFNRCIN